MWGAPPPSFRHCSIIHILLSFLQKRECGRRPPPPLVSDTAIEGNIKEISFSTCQHNIHSLLSFLQKRECVHHLVTHTTKRSTTACTTFKANANTSSPRIAQPTTSRYKFATRDGTRVRFHGQNQYFFTTTAWRWPCSRI